MLSPWLYGIEVFPSTPEMKTKHMNRILIIFELYIVYVWHCVHVYETVDVFGRVVSARIHIVRLQHRTFL